MGSNPTLSAILLRAPRFAGFTPKPDAKQDVGLTTDLKRRITDHNSGKSTHTNKFRPWRPVTYIAFSEQAKAETFERCLKSGSGHAFADKRLW